MMRVSLRSVVAGGAAILAAASVTTAMAGDTQIHVLNVRLPGGGIEHIQYAGDVAPRVVLLPAPAMVTVPVMAPDPFAALERISALMHQQEAAMLRQVEALTAAPAGMMPGLPPGARGYSFVSTTSGSGVCTRSMRITYTGGNATPQVVSSSVGDCGPGHGAQAPAEVNAPAPVRPAPGTIEVKATDQTPDGGPMRQVAWNR